MAKHEAIDFSQPLEEIFGGGGGYFTDGTYRTERARFTYYDFNKGPDNSSLCFMAELQALDGAGKDTDDEPKLQYWPLNAKTREGVIMVEPVGPVKGEKGCFQSIRLTDANTHGKLYSRSDFYIWMEAARKAEVDMDAVGNDITSLDGQVFEWGKQLIKDDDKRATAVEQAEGGDTNKRRYPKEVVVITAVVGKKGKSKSAAKDKAAAKDEKPAAKGKGKKDADDPESILLAYLEENVCTDDNEDGTPHLSHKLALSRYLAKDLGKDPAEVKEVMAMYNDTETQLPALLTSLGWELDGKEIKKSE